MSEFIDLSEVFARKQHDSAFSHERPDALRTAHEELSHIDLVTPPESVARILDTPYGEIAEVGMEDFSLLVRNHLLSGCRKSHLHVGENTYLTLQYAEELLSDFLLGANRAQQIVEKPYVIDWMVEENYQMAGDAAVFGYCFLVGKRGNKLTPRDYSRMAESCYAEWHARSTGHNIGDILSGNISSFLPILHGTKSWLGKPGLHAV